MNRTQQHRMTIPLLALAAFLIGIGFASPAHAVEAPDHGGGGGHWVTIPAHYECLPPCPTGYYRSGNQCLPNPTNPGGPGGCTSGGKPMMDSADAPCDAM
jgi:hypothetical protein